MIRKLLCLLGVLVLLGSLGLNVYQYHKNEVLRGNMLSYISAISEIMDEKNVILVPKGSSSLVVTGLLPPLDDRKSTIELIRVIWPLEKANISHAEEVREGQKVYLWKGLEKEYALKAAERIQHTNVNAAVE